MPYNPRKFLIGPKFTKSDVPRRAMVAKDLFATVLGADKSAFHVTVEKSLWARKTIKP